ncbi:MAG: Gfo/Idh/MocA family oxidoreductase [Nitrosopumilus sp.]|nr:Gfo/Idh/MocA family oxidoreductase [Nitrosopumilus sp.]
MKVVQIGLGVWGEKNASIFSDLGILSAVCDSNTQKLKGSIKKKSVNHYESTDNLIASEHFDGAFVDTAVSNCVDTITKLISEKKHVFVKKSTMFDLTEVEKLIEMSLKKKVIFTCGFDGRFNQTVKQVKKFVREKKYGDLTLLEFYCKSKKVPQNQRGIVFESSINDIDSSNWIFDEMPVVVFARLDSNSEKENFASIMLGYKDNKTAIILSNGLLSKEKRNLRAICSKAVVCSDLISQEIKVENEDAQVLPKEDSVLLQVQNFIGAMQGKNEIAVKTNEIVNVTKVAEAALLSGKQGVPIYLDLK